MLTWGDVLNKLQNDGEHNLCARLYELVDETNEALIDHIEGLMDPEDVEIIREILEDE